MRSTVASRSSTWTPRPLRSDRSLHRRACRSRGRRILVTSNRPAFASGELPFERRTVNKRWIMKMKTRLMGFAVAAALAAAPTFPSFAEDASPAPAAGSTTTPAATPNQPPPVSVPRPSIMPNTAEPSKPVAADKPVATERPVVTDEPASRRNRRYVRRHWRYAYWQPFPIYWPHLYRSHIYWSRIPWFF
jgi:hypothetical protein